MANVTFRRGTTADLAKVPITDGLVLFDTENHKIYIDNKTIRLQYGGDTDLISQISQATPTNTFNANAELSLFLQKASCVNDGNTALAVTENDIPLGCKAFAEKIGAKDFSKAGNTVSDALVNLSQYVSKTLTAGETSLVITNNNFNENTNFSVYTNSFKVTPKDMVLNGSKLTLSFDSQTTDIGVRVYYKNIV